MKIGFIGLRRRMCGRLLDHGNDVLVFNRTQNDAVHELEARGAFRDRFGVSPGQLVRSAMVR